MRQGYERFKLISNSKKFYGRHKTLVDRYSINTLDDDADLPSLYWIPKLHKDPNKHRFKAGSAKCSTKPLSKLLTTILTTVKDCLKK